MAGEPQDDAWSVPTATWEGQEHRKLDARQGPLGTQEKAQAGSPTPTFLVHLHSPVFSRAAKKLCTERGGIGGQVLVQDTQQLRHWLLVADGDLLPVGLRGMVIHIQQGQQQGS